MTPFGAKVRELRAKQNITLKEMAEALSVSSAYLSALEHGKRGTPTWYMVQRIITYFNVIWDEAEELQRLAELSNPKITIDTGGLTPRATELTNMLASKINGLSEESLEHLIHQLRVVSSRDNI
ncbi:transcriptional regulator, XRE family [Pseudovibrio sp. FO-BEG1]|uniref:Transcriptional regulator n=1 Tax=Pseudovibrio denitrificans TaxID=258256 RepID=A0A1I7ASZ0_9HYPH|nr:MULTISPECIES: helix-turn-helix domain-containing protein [Pseudovibrio]AEV34857.1 transcriptional regulator, XRE family [Pseudovibrio sp. FO-BEG1]EEA93701.1 transcriptional regulator [Pseudovibrio sp. JE062]SFT78023.1 transcriptional regulator [Pseudovibrio denitrificans]